MKIDLFSLSPITVT